VNAWDPTGENLVIRLYGKEHLSKMGWTTAEIEAVAEAIVAVHKDAGVKDIQVIWSNDDKGFWDFNFTSWDREEKNGVSVQRLIPKMKLFDSIPGKMGIRDLSMTKNMTESKRRENVTKLINGLNHEIGHTFMNKEYGMDAIVGYPQGEKGTVMQKGIEGSKLLNYSEADKKKIPGRLNNPKDTEASMIKWE
jgi:hypothetical protein